MTITLINVHERMITISEFVTADLRSRVLAADSTPCWTLGYEHTRVFQTVKAAFFPADDEPGVG